MAENTSVNHEEEMSEILIELIPTSLQVIEGQAEIIKFMRELLDGYQSSITSILMKLQEYEIPEGLAEVILLEGKMFYSNDAANQYLEKANDKEDARTKLLTLLKRVEELKESYGNE